MRMADYTMQLGSETIRELNELKQSYDPTTIEKDKTVDEVLMQDLLASYREAIENFAKEQNKKNKAKSNDNDNDSSEPEEGQQESQKTEDPLDFSSSN